VDLFDFLIQQYAPGQLNLSANAEEQLAVAVRRLNAYAKRPVDTRDLSKELLTGWLKSLAQAGQAAATINGKRSAILTLWRAAHRSKKARKPPAGVEVPTKRAPRRLPNSWTVEQMERIVEECRALRGKFRLSGMPKGPFMTSLVLFEYETGTRFSASLAVKPSDVNIETGLVYLRTESAKTGLEQVHWLSPQCLQAIQAIWDPNRSFVWPWGPNRHGLWATLKAVLQSAGLPQDRRSMFHRFRRTTATILTARAGISIASAALGHTSEEMTRRVYVDPTNLGTPRPIDVLPRLGG
jgi:integrase